MTLDWKVDGDTHEVVVGTFGLVVAPRERGGYEWTVADGEQHVAAGGARRQVSAKRYALEAALLAATA